jgi:Rrf2 family protein
MKYALLAMTELADRYPNGFISVTELAERQGMPRLFLEQLLLKLKKSGLTESRRGPDGGYALAKPPDEIRIGDIFSSVDKPLELRFDFGEDVEAQATRRAAHLMCLDLEKKIIRLFNAATLKDLKLRTEEIRQKEVRKMKQTFSI